MGQVRWKRRKGRERGREKRRKGNGKWVVCKGDCGLKKRLKSRVCLLTKKKKKNRKENYKTVEGQEMDGCTK